MTCSNCIHENVCLRNFFGFYEADECGDYFAKDNVKVIDRCSFDGDCSYCSHNYDCKFRED